MLDVFKHKENFLSKSKRKEFYFVLKFDENGGYIEITDKKGKEIQIDYKSYFGVQREILKTIDEYKNELLFEISWEEKEDKIYLDEVPRIIELLKSVDNFVDEDFNKIEFEKEIKKFTLKIEKKDKIKLTPSFTKMLSREYAYENSKIIPVFNVGDNFNKLKNFDILIDEKNLEEVLSVFVSNFENVEIDYEEYETQYSKALLKPALIFEKVTSDKRLVLKILASFGNFPPNFFEEFNPTHLVAINDMEKKLNILECNYEKVIEFYQDILKTLTSIKRKSKSDFFEENGEFILDKEIAEEFLSKKIVDIVRECQVYGKEKLKEYKYTPIKPKVNLKVEFKNKIDLLGDVDIEFEDETFNVFDFIKTYKKNSYIPLKDGNKGIIDKSYIEKLERIFKKEDNKVKVSFFDLPEIEKLIEKKSSRAFSVSKKFFNGFNKLNKSRITYPTLNATLRNYQKFGVKWFKYLYDNGFGGCLADDMGLGKTLQTIALISLIYDKIKEPILIVMPKTLLNNWQNEIKKFSTLKYYVYYGIDRDIEKLKNSKLILTTYGTLRNDIEKLKEIKFDTVILDESQNIKNIESKTSKAVLLLNAEHRFALSGTPIENSLFELYALFRFLNPGMFGNVSEFKRNYVIPIQANANEEIANALKAKVSPFILRRLKLDVLDDLPQKQENVVIVDMNEKQKEFYQKTKAQYKALIDEEIEKRGFEKSKFFVFQILNELRIIATAPELKNEDITSSKIQTLFEMLEDIVLNNHKVLIFSNFLGVLDLIVQKAEERGIEYLKMTGATRNREELVKKFQENKNIKLFLLTLKVGGVGLNLTSADYVFIVDPWWNVAAENQAIDRVYRIGQKNKVFSYKLITKDTIEEKIIKLQEEKKNLSDLIIKPDEIIKTLSKEEIEYILGD